jgi:hypothetical protein
MNALVLDGLAPQFESWSNANLHAALIVRHGRLVYERYFTGEDRAGATHLGRVTYHAGLRHDLTMSAGLAWNEQIPYSNPANSEVRMMDAPDRSRYVLEQPTCGRLGQPTITTGA